MRIFSGFGLYRVLSENMGWTRIIDNIDCVSFSCKLTTKWLAL
jgi:hypothetical protein